MTPKKLRDIDDIVDVSRMMGLPMKSVINLYGTEESFEQLNKQLRNLGSGNVFTKNLGINEKHTVVADQLIYCGYVFNLIYVDKTLKQPINETT